MTMALPFINDFNRETRIGKILRGWIVVIYIDLETASEKYLLLISHTPETGSIVTWMANGQILLL